MSNVLIVIVVVALVIAYVVYRKRQTGNNVRPDEIRKVAKQGNSNYHAVSLKYSANACQAAVDMDGRRFLSGVAPRIPLAGCDASECRCKFVHHDDRRSQEDRRDPYGQSIGISKAGQLADEKRASSERREDSPNDFL